MVPQDSIASMLSPLLGAFKAQRSGSESFGDFCHRVGKETLQGFAAQASVA
jgi:sulfite reductase (ferredoxin)